MKLLLCTLLLLSLLTFPSCQHNSDLTPDGGPDSTDVGVRPESSAPGFGNSKARPLGTPFALPTGVTVVATPRFDEDCWTEALKKKQVKGSGGLVEFGLSLRNDNDHPVRIELPPGLIWIARTNTTYQDIPQNGLIVKTVVILIPAYTTECVWLLAYCINSDRSVTRTGDTYEATPVVSNHPGVKALAQQLANKKINEDEFSPEPTQAERSQLAFIGVAVEDVASYGTVQPSTQKYIDQLPNSK
ncbi:hypothetical protein [Fibrella aquatilis]|uniref:Lipoprotein n=1 Tax=Fibrella aquatilis TaxID=2817059 RepID=A0A939G370_9BACT|nr:hypothetical protein [Fibrella aquatilis]MBO0930245.1 hypothetical protein [Fibrella aquatilis]